LDFIEEEAPAKQIFEGKIGKYIKIRRFTLKNNTITLDL
jgi:hypothetical protein